MKYFSLNHKAPEVSFQDAVVKGLAPDKGLYFPKEIHKLPTSFFETIDTLDHVTIAYEAIKQFVGDEIPGKDLKAILKDVLSFDFPIVSVEENISALELYHGPTMAFKDVGARFMARCLGYFNKQKGTKEDVTVLVATSGDTGGAVASGFLGVDGVEVVILYPSGKVSDIQEKQLTTLGQNITALEVDGVFDDCQDMVKKAFLDEDLKTKHKLTSANSINIARWLPQMFYFFFAYKALKRNNKKLVFSVPSGNYGNICAGMMAQRLGLPIHHFVTGTNANNIVPEYLKTGTYTTKSSVQTISNAMDVGAPSNFIRIEELHHHDFNALKTNLSGYSYTDEQTVEAINYLKDKHNYIADPHGAIGYLALKKYLETTCDAQGVFLETAHPIKFLPVLPKAIKESITMPPQIEAIIDREKHSLRISNYDQLKTYLLQ
ncbi:threonine synthase [Winogradskyella flava]|uniref:threonine synthase n=1 Tax=Winogradskyella flava TaxID=1884876 RepID=UPI002490F16B|nr:threonine synthase [Winogradskyella flava]